MIEFSDNYVVSLIKIRRGLEEFKFLLGHIPRNYITVPTTHVLMNLVEDF
jgi:hypothetical protein